MVSDKSADVRSSIIIKILLPPFPDILRKRSCNHCNDSKVKHFLRIPSSTNSRECGYTGYTGQPSDSRNLQEILHSDTPSSMIHIVEAYDPYIYNRV